MTGTNKQDKSNSSVKDDANIVDEVTEIVFYIKFFLSFYLS